MRLGLMRAVGHGLYFQNVDVARFIPIHSCERTTEIVERDSRVLHWTVRSERASPIAARGRFPDVGNARTSRLVAYRNTLKLPRLPICSAFVLLCFLRCM